jgi:hypothetical protein
MIINKTITQAPGPGQTLLKLLFKFNKNRPPSRVGDFVDRFDIESNH